jgi:pyrroline-5-carboxylate reductase
MSGAMVEGWRQGGASLADAVVIRPSGRPVNNIRTVTTYGEAGPSPRLVLLGMKPQQLNEVTPKLAPFLTSRSIVVSILAGVEAASLRQRFPNAGAIVRAIPNLPVAVRRGVVALYSDDIPDGLRDEVSQLFAMLGYALWTSSETNLAAIGSVAGAGPAYVARFVDALTKAGVDRGLSQELASTIALETVLGTSWMAATTREPMDDVVRRVASPNGTTEAGLAVLNREDVLDKLISLTVAAASRRGAELAAEAKGANLAEPQRLP